MMYQQTHSIEQYLSKEVINYLEEIQAEERIKNLLE